MPRDLLPLVSIQVLGWFRKGRSYSQPMSCGAYRAAEVGITALLLVLFCGSSALADDFGLGTAGPGNWGILETGTGMTVNLVGGGSNNPTGITVNPGATATGANVGINTGGTLSTSTATFVAGTYFRSSTNNDKITGQTTIVGGTVTNNTKLTTAASDAQTASANLANPAINPPTQPTVTTPITGGTINATVPGRNVIVLNAGINLGNGVTLTLSGSATQSFVINIPSGGMTLGTASSIVLSGGLTAANVIFNVTGGNVSATSGPSVINGIVMDLNATVDISGPNSTVNGEIISGQTISLNNGADVEVVVPEPSTAAYFTLGPLSLLAVMLLHRHFSRRKQMVVAGSHNPPESVLGAAKWC